MASTRSRAERETTRRRRRDNWTYKGVPMDTSSRDTEGRAPLYLYYEHCYGPFVDREDARRLYEKYPRSESCFRGVDRIKLLMSILSAPTRDGGAGLPLDKLVRRKACDAAFPLHEEDELKSLEARWIRMWARPAQLPSERVRSYFGEKIAFYYLFLAHATTYFSYAAVIGFAVFLNTLISPQAENAASVPYFCAYCTASVASLSRRRRVDPAMLMPSRFASMARRSDDRRHAGSWASGPRSSSRPGKEKKVGTPWSGARSGLRMSSATGPSTPRTR